MGGYINRQLNLGDGCLKNVSYVGKQLIMLNEKYWMWWVKTWHLLWLYEYKLLIIKMVLPSKEVKIMIYLLILHLFYNAVSTVAEVILSTMNIYLPS